MGKGFEAQTGEATLRGGEGEGVFVARAVRALSQVGEVVKLLESRARFGLRAREFHNGPDAAGGHRCAGREPGVELRGERGFVALQFSSERRGGGLPLGFRVTAFLRLHLEVHDAAHRRRESGEHPVVVLVRERVVFVVVTAGAADGEAEERGARGREHVVHRVVARALDFVGGDLRGEHTRAEKARGAEGQRVVRLELIARELPAQELVERQVAVERFDDEVAEVKSAGAVVVVFEAAALGEARDIQPVPRPTLAVARGVEQAGEEFRPRVGGGVFEEVVHGLGCWRDAVQVEVSAADERALVRGRGEGARGGFGEEEAVNGIADCRLPIADGGRRRARERLKRPPLPVLIRHFRFVLRDFAGEERAVVRRAVVNPRGEAGDDIRGKFVRLRRHVRLLGVVDEFEQPTLRSAERHDGRAFGAALEQLVARGEVEAALGLLTAVAAEAALHEHRANVLGEGDEAARHALGVVGGERGGGEGGRDEEEGAKRLERGRPRPQPRHSRSRLAAEVGVRAPLRRAHSRVMTSSRLRRTFAVTV